MNYSRPTAFLIIALLIPNLLAQDTAAIKRQLQQCADEWQMHFDNRDASELAKLYAVDCDVIHEDQPSSSRAEVQVEYEKHFSDNPNVTTEFHDVKRRVLSDSVAIESGIWTEANHSAPGMATEGTYTSVYEKRNGEWLIVHERAWPRKNPPLTAKAFVEHLCGGTWHLVKPTGKGTEDTYQRILGGQFVRMCSTGLDSGKVLGIIGIDPENELQTWWTFREDGSVDKLKLTATTIAGDTEHVKLLSDDPAGLQLDYQFKRVDSSHSEMTGTGKFRNINLPFNTTWERSEEVADLSWLDAQPPAKLPPQMSGLRHILGAKWIQVQNPDGSTGLGTSMGRWILDGKFFLYTASHVFEDGSDWTHTLVQGKDPASGKFKGWEFNSDGQVGTYILSDDGRNLTGSTVRRKELAKPGETLHFSGKFETVGDAYRYSASIGKEGEKPLPYVWTWRDAEVK